MHPARAIPEILFARKGQMPQTMRDSRRLADSIQRLERLRPRLQRDPHLAELLEESILTLRHLHWTECWLMTSSESRPPTEE
jgi:hypothetical protein